MSNDTLDVAAMMLSKRTRKKISVSALKKCLQTSGMNIRDLTTKLDNNYSFMIPSAWISTKKDANVRDLMASYEDDIATATNANVYIPPKKEGIMRLATYNVHYWTDPLQRPNVSDILEVISETGSDIVCLQEALIPWNEPRDFNVKYMGSSDKIQVISVSKISECAHRDISSIDGWKHDDLLGEISDLGFPYMSSSASSTTHANTGTFFGNSVLSKTPMEPVGLSLNSKTQGRSVVLTLHENLWIRGAQKGVVIISIHLDVFDETGLERRAQLRQLIDFVESFKKVIPIIVAGDFNALKREDYTENEVKWLKNNNKGNAIDFETIKLLETAGFRDVFDIQNRCSLKYSTWSARRTDYIFIKNIPETSIRDTYAFYSAASDHIPLVVDIDLQQPEGL